MTWRWQSFAVPKRGNSAEEYEDAFAGDLQLGRFAIADGAAESSFASLWARLLVEGYTHPLLRPRGREKWLEPLRQQWSQEVDELELPWYAEAKRALGASAAFLGLTLKRSGNSRGAIWLALAVGDCCIFQLRQEQLVKAFPLTRSEDFNDRPTLLNSRPGESQSAQDGQQRCRGKWCVGDRLFLMTDAVAHWFLRTYEEDGKPWQAIAQVLEQAAPDRAFDAWIGALRAQGALRNDDVTLAFIEL